MGYVEYVDLFMQKEKKGLRPIFFLKTPKNPRKTRLFPDTTIYDVVLHHNDSWRQFEFQITKFKMAFKKHKNIEILCILMCAH